LKNPNYIGTRVAAILLNSKLIQTALELVTMRQIGWELSKSIEHHAATQGIP
jgi:hypothetical protein